ncbi:MAG TPA: hypothetical protein VFX02_00945 [Gammaproteobacteria bacterium]|nr:hypothetical protein [Gammaproteobacteria bacterium]
MLSLANSDAMAYSEDTHEEITGAAVIHSILNPANIAEGEKPVMESLGLQAWDQEQFSLTVVGTNGPNGPFTKLEDIVRFGASYEDMKNQTRVFNHFFDPISGEPLHLTFLELGAPSPDWALEDQHEIEDIPLSLRLLFYAAVKGDVPAANAIINSLFDKQQDYSYRDMMSNFYLALTSQSSGVRQQNWGELFQRLGHVIHHVQDMAQPEHVRNDPHLDVGEMLKGLGILDEAPQEGSETEILLRGINGVSLYEKFTRKQVILNPGLIEGMLNASDYDHIDVVMTNPRSYWTTPDGKGMADFTNMNFVSNDTNFLMEGGVIVADESEYDKPEPGDTHVEPLVNLTVYGEVLGNYDTCEFLKQTSPVPLPPDYDCPIEFVETDIDDRYTGAQDVKNERASSLSVFDKYLEDFEVTPVITPTAGGAPVQVDRVFTLNRYNYDSFQRFLLPRAVKYSAGLINQVFKKRLSLRKNPNGIGWIVENISNQTLNGEFKLLADGVVLQRHLLGIQNINLTPGSSFLFPATLQDQTTTQMVVSFRGGMGGVLAGFDSVTGTVTEGPDGQRGYSIHDNDVDCNLNPIPPHIGLAFILNGAAPWPGGSFEPSIVTDTGFVVDFDAVNVQSGSRPETCESVGFDEHITRIGDFEYIHIVSETDPQQQNYILNVYNYQAHPELSLNITHEKIYVTNKDDI